MNHRYYSAANKTETRYIVTMPSLRSVHNTKDVATGLGVTRSAQKQKIAMGGACDEVSGTTRNKPIIPKVTHKRPSSVSAACEVDLISSQSIECGFNCGLCCKPVDTDEIEISSLQCCLCSTYYHGCCLDLDDDVLALLYVVKNLNGWCCEKCRRAYKNYKTFTDIPIDSSQKKPCRANDKSTVLQQEKISSLAIDMIVVKSQLQCIVDDLKQLPKTPHAEVLSEEAAIMIDPASAGTSVIDTSSWKEFRGRNNRKLPVLTSNSNSKKNPSLDQDTREAMLVAMHSEMSTINRRSTAVVVSGLPVRSDVPDIDQFNNICIQHLHFNPTVKSACRLGKRIEGKMQPLLVHLSSSNEVTSLMNVAKKPTHSIERLRENMCIYKSSSDKGRGDCCLETS